MSEAGYVELPVIAWLSGHGSHKPGDQGLGWTYRDEAAMAAFNRPLTDPLVEPLLIEALLRINDDVHTEAQAQLAVNALRKALAQPDKLTANRATLDLLRDGATVVLTPGEPAKTVRFIEFDPARQCLNDFTATNQYRVQGVKQCRADTVLLVNGIPLVIAEYKSYLASGKDWTEAVQQLHRYQRQAPLLLAPNVFCVAADEQEFRYGTVLFHDASQNDITQHLDTWGPWRSRYPDRKGWWKEPDADYSDDPLEIPVNNLLRLKPCHLLDFLQNFVVFETQRGKTIKKIARYQQFEAVNDLVDRTLKLIGQPAAAQDRTGLIWHTQGSGKSLTMIFAAYKLRRQPALKNPTVIIVVDRRDLKTQIADDFEACDYPNVEKALGVEDLKRKLKTVWRGALVTTVQSFQKMADLPPLTDDNLITLVDECHRSQKGSSADSYAMTMRVKLPNAFRFGFTGTPIDRTMTNTHRDFGPVVNGQQERYLSYYGIKRAIKDGATLEVHYLRDKVPFLVDEKALNIGFEQMCAEMELEDEAAKDQIQRQRSQWKELARQPEGSDVIISAGQNDGPDLERFHYGKQKQDDLIDYFKLTPAQWELWNRERYGDDRTQWRQPLKILIVCDRLLTGFDAPIEQVMYLDKPLRDHTLLQAIARTNRPLPAMNKRTGVVVDFFGVFADLEKALNFDENIREEAIIDWEALKATVPGEVQRCLDSFKGMAIADTRECLLAALRALQDPDAARIFEHNFKSLERLWEAVSPDPCLYPHRHSYNRLCGIYIAHRRRQRGSRDTLGELSAKTQKLIGENTAFVALAESLPVFKIDQNYVAKLDELPTPADKAAALEALLTAELAEEEPSFTYRQLGERLQHIKERKDAADQAAEARLMALQDIADEAAKVKEEPARLVLTQTGEYELFTVLQKYAATQDERFLADCARKMITHLHDHQLLLLGWSASKGGRMRVEQSLLAESWNPAYAALGFDPDTADPPFLKPAVEELAKMDRA